jgi:hypothetical protein
MVRLWGLIACVAAAFAVFYLGARTPDPAPTNAPADVFSAGRAIEDIRVIGAVPHPIGSPANAQVRDYLIGRMRSLGLSPQVQRAQSVYAPPKAVGVIFGATVENLIGVLPGKNHDLPAVALMAHYDSVPASPGAADDAAGVASALEIVRAIRARGTPERDVMVVITDGEEAGLLGANAFYADHPLAPHVGVVLNMEARGNGGRASMFQTGPANGADIALYREAARGPESNSLEVFIYKLLPNDTDMTISLAKGVPGMNFAFIGRQFDYHAPTATVANLDQGAIQSLGDQVQGVAMALAFSGKLPARAADVVYGNLPFGVLAAYPTAAGWVLLALSAAAAAFGAISAWRARAFSWRDLWKGVGASSLVLIVAVLSLYVTRLATGARFGFFAQRELLARFPQFELAMFAAGLAAVLLIAAAMAAGKGRRAGALAVFAAGLVLAALGGFKPPLLAPSLIMAVVGAALAYLTLGRSACMAGVWTGILLTGLGATLALQIAAPTAALIFAWPVAAASATSALLAAGSGKSRIAWILGTVLAVLALSWVGGSLHAFMEGLDQPVLPAVVVWIGAMVIWPLAWPKPVQTAWAYGPGALALAASLAIALYLNLTSPWSARYPDAVMPLYVTDHDTGKAWRVNPEPPDAWVRGVLTADGGAVGKRTLPGFRGPVFAAPAKAVAAPAPAIAIARGPDGTITLTAPSTPQTLSLALDLKTDTVVADARVNGRPTKILTTPGKPTRFFLQGPPETVTVSFKPVGPGALEIAYAAYLVGWPADAKPLPPMPPTVMGFDLAGSTVVVGRLRQSW